MTHSRRSRVSLIYKTNLEGFGWLDAYVATIGFKAIPDYA